MAQHGPPVVTIFEQYGAGAAPVGQKVAEHMGLPFHGQAFSSEDLEQADERLDGTAVLAQVLSTLGGAYGGIGDRDIVATQAQKYDLIMDNNKVVWDSSDEGGVIVGRNGARILADRPNTLHVLLTGDREARVRQAAQTDGLDEATARRRQEKEDDVRVQISKVLYGWDPSAPDRYDLVLDTSQTGVDGAVQAIVDALKEMPR